VLLATSPDWPDGHVEFWTAPESPHETLVSERPHEYPSARVTIGNEYPLDVGVAGMFPRMVSVGAKESRFALSVLQPSSSKQRSTVCSAWKPSARRFPKPWEPVARAWRAGRLRPRSRQRHAPPARDR
jgi:hypothetical protein